ncbi:MAG: hypothetical protein E6X49_22140 [Leclercia adecarboxylata]|nr:hypothetical protein [uncultured Leclercia sp.]MDU4843818.1 hypothetical protein [Leclercia adecarboxylata]
MTSEKLLIKDRVCGSCSVCCVSLRINTPGLKKKADIPCANIRPQGGCAIYNERPPVCRTWHCGWRMLPIMDSSLRPDRSNILIRFNGEEWFFQAADNLHISSILTNEMLKVIAAMIMNNGKVTISIPTRSGFCNALVELNAPLKDAIESRSLVKVKSILQSLIIQNSKSITKPITA